MKSHNTLIILGFCLLFKMSCQKGPKNLHGVWNLDKVTTEKPITTRTIDSMKCIDNVPFGYSNGVAFKMTDDNDPRPMPFEHFLSYNNEVWTFGNAGSLAISREGNEPSSTFCENGEVRSLLLTAFSTYEFTGSWKSKNDVICLSVKSDDDIEGGKFDFKILTLNDQELVIKEAEGDKTLSFVP